MKQTVWKRIIFLATLLAITAAAPLLGPTTPAEARPIQTAQSEDPKKDWDIPDQVSSHRRIVPDDGKPVVQVALLLDTSGSMSGLIDQAKTELWSIVNALGQARYKGQIPRLEVALFEYGRSSLSPQQGYIRQLSPLSSDLDGISETLFALETNGGQEYCAWVLRTALQTQPWKVRKGSLRMAFIAGNESFYQGPVSFKPVLKKAQAQGVLVHPIYCDNGNGNDKLTWKQAAALAQTDLKVIDHNTVVVDPKTPYDDDIQKLGVQLNKTYIAYGEGSKRAQYRARQSAQDDNSVAAGAGVSRSVSKASTYYNNKEWDVVDAEKAGEVSVEELSAAQLPEEMREMSKTERKAYVVEKAEERKQLQSQIRDLEKKRQAYIAKERQQSVQPASLGKAVMRALEKQASKSGFTLD